LTSLPDGTTLVEAITRDPLAAFGPTHVARHGADPALLVKLLDTAERLVVHFHPDREFAMKHLGSVHGKTEAWVILDVDEDRAGGAAGEVFLGFRGDVKRSKVQVWMDLQDSAAMLEALNKVSLSPGDTLLVPAGMPHALGAGLTLLELQEPTDFSILLEWAGYNIEAPHNGSLGLGHDIELDALDVGAVGEERLQELITRAEDAPPELGVTRLLPEEADRFFVAQRIDVWDQVELPAGYAIVLVISGQGVIESQESTIEVSRGSSILCGYAAGPLRLCGQFRALRCSPPV
jgi:mannose-6-phosphate isomerase